MIATVTGVATPASFALTNVVGARRRADVHVVEEALSDGALLVLTTDGRTLNGFLVERDDKIVVLRGADGQTTVIGRDQIDDMKVIPQSLMPEGLLQGLADQQVRDLFAYLRSGQPLNDDCTVVELLYTG